MLTTVSTLVNDINSLSIGPNVSLPLGSFAFTGTQIAGPSAPADASDLTNPLNLLGNSPLSSITTADLTAAAQNAMNSFNVNSAVAPLGLSGSATQAINDLQSNVSFAFPLLEHPSSVLDLLFGQDVNLVTASASIGFSGGPYQIFSASIPIFWPFSVNVSMNAGFSVGAALAVGYDTYGFREALVQLHNGNPTAGQLASDISEGFYISQPNSNLSFSVYTNLFAGVGISVGFAGASIGLNGGVTGTVNIGLNPSAAINGKIRLLELSQELSAGNLFNVSGSITAGLALAFHWYINYLIGSQTLVRIRSTTLARRPSGRWPAPQQTRRAAAGRGGRHGRRRPRPRVAARLSSTERTSIALPRCSSAASGRQSSKISPVTSRSRSRQKLPAWSMCR